MRTIVRFALLASLSALPAAGHAKVYSLWGSASDSARTIERLGGKLAYKAPVVVNGGKGELAAFSFTAPIADVVDKLRQGFGNRDAVRYSGGTMAEAVIKDEGHAIRLIVLSMEDRAGTFVFRFDQPAGEAAASEAKPRTHLMAEAPAYPGSEPVFYVKDESTRMTLAISKGRADAEDVHRFYRAHLSGTGWTALKPGSGSMRVYLKQNEVFCVLVESSDAPGDFRATLLHKERGIE
jgi:hypothetical protein